jgi:hypothetical protein
METREQTGGAKVLAYPVPQELITSASTGIPPNAKRNRCAPHPQ